MKLSFIYFLSSLKNAALYQKRFIIIRYNILCIPFLKGLYNDGYVLSYQCFQNHQGRYYIKIYLRLTMFELPVKDLTIISKPSNIKSLSYRELSRLSIGIRNTLYLFTDKGLKTHSECKQLKIGGQVLYLC